MGNDSGSKLTYFIAGLGIGAAFGLLFAPTSRRRDARLPDATRRRWPRIRAAQSPTNCATAPATWWNAASRWPSKAPNRFPRRLMRALMRTSARSPKQYNQRHKRDNPWKPGCLIFVGVVALAVVIQTIILAVMAVVVSKTAKREEEIAGDVHGRVNPIFSRIQILVEESQPRINAVIADAAEISHLARGQAQRVDRVMSESLERLRLQMLHLDQLVTGAMESVEDAGTKVKRTVWAPVRSVTAVVRGIQTGSRFLPWEPPPRGWRTGRCWRPAGRRSRSSSDFFI